MVDQLNNLLLFGLLSNELSDFVLTLPQTPLKLTVSLLSGDEPLFWREDTFYHLYFECLERCDGCCFPILWFAVTDHLFAVLHDRSLVGGIV